MCFGVDCHIEQLLIIGEEVVRIADHAAAAIFGGVVAIYLDQTLADWSC